MNALYVTVSIPLLLVLAGFNHAHGLTTFGKSNNQGAQQPQQPASSAKHCSVQADCNTIKGTTCLKGFCLCGDNRNPSNGACSAQYKGPKHLCTKDAECVDGADCLPRKDKKPNNSSNSNSGSSSSGSQTNSDPNLEKICQCQEGLLEMSTMCGSASSFSLLPGLILIFTVLVKTLN